MLTKTRSTTTAALRRSNPNYPQSNKIVIADHIYLASALIKSPKNTTARFYLHNVVSNQFNISANIETFVCGIMKPTGENEGGFNIYYDASNVMNIGESATIRNVMLFDLTVMFGATIADYIYNLEQSSIETGGMIFKKFFPNNYYEYNAGEIVHVSGL